MGKSFGCVDITILNVKIFQYRPMSGGPNRENLEYQKCFVLAYLQPQTASEIYQHKTL